jgi:formate hydrogenlyase subunit 3/multisubunit Na+/H+ antiporter MnhD subunit
MTLTPLIPIVILLVGTLALLLSLLLPARYPGPAAATTAGLALLALVGLRGALPVEAIVSFWQPMALSGVPISLRLDGMAWLYALALAALALAALLTGLSRPGGRRTANRGFTLLLLAAGLAAISSANLLTLCLSWTFLDVTFLGAIALTDDRERVSEHTTFALAANGLATLLVWVVALLGVRDGGSQVLHLFSFSALQMALLALAAILRLGLYPLHAWLPAQVDLRPGVAAMLHLAPATAGLSLLSQLVLGARGDLPLDNPLTYAAAAALVVGALLAWGQDEAGHALSFVVLAQTGLVVLSGTWGGEDAALALVAEGLVLLLSAGVLFFSRGYDPEHRLWSAPGAIAAVALVAMPLTLGFVGRSALLAAFARADAWLLLVASGVAQALLVATLLRLIARPAAGQFPASPLVRGLGALGLAGLVAPLIIFGLAPDRLADLLGVAAPSLLEVLARMPTVGWIVWALGVGVGVLLWWRDSHVRAIRGQLHPPLQALFSLRWFYRLIAGLVEVAGRAIRAAALLLEGEGALLWVLVVLVLAWLFTQPR